MKADATAEKRPAYPFLSEIRDISVETTYKYQGGVEVIVVLLAKVPVVFVSLFFELFVKARSRVWFLLLESRLDRSGQVIAQPTHDVKCETCERI